MNRSPTTATGFRFPESRWLIDQLGFVVRLLWIGFWMSGTFDGKVLSLFVGLSSRIARLVCRATISTRQPPPIEG